LVQVYQPNPIGPWKVQVLSVLLLQKLGGVVESPKLVAKAEKEKADKKSTLSAKQAGKVAPRKAKAEATAPAH